MHLFLFRPGYFSKYRDNNKPHVAIHRWHVPPRSLESVHCPPDNGTCFSLSLSINSGGVSPSRLKVSGYQPPNLPKAQHKAGSANPVSHPPSIAGSDATQPFSLFRRPWG